MKLFDAECSIYQSRVYRGSTARPQRPASFEAAARIGLVGGRGSILGSGGRMLGISEGCVGACAGACAARCLLKCIYDPGGCDSCVDGCMDGCAVNC